MKSFDKSSTDPVAPAVVIIHLDSIRFHTVFKHIFQVLIIGRFFKIKCTTVYKKLFENVRETFAQPVDRY